MKNLTNHSTISIFIELLFFVVNFISYLFANEIVSTKYKNTSDNNVQYLNETIMEPRNDNGTFNMNETSFNNHSSSCSSVNFTAIQLISLMEQMNQNSIDLRKELENFVSNGRNDSFQIKNKIGQLQQVLNFSMEQVSNNVSNVNMQIIESMIDQLQGTLNNYMSKISKLGTMMRTIISLGEITKQVNLTQPIQTTRRDERVVETEKLDKKKKAARKKIVFEMAAERKRQQLLKAKDELVEKYRWQDAYFKETIQKTKEPEPRIVELHMIEMKKLEEEIEAIHKELQLIPGLERNNQRELEERHQCLKAGTKILMANGLEKPIEEIKRGDHILDQGMMPSRVLAATQWFLGKQYFYGFEENLQFFTKTHLFVGQFRSYYAVSKNDHIQTNPLMAYENLNDMENVFKILKFENDNIFPQNCSLFKDPIVYPENTPVYFIEVDNPSGTYIANGFISRHDIPDFSLWPRTTEVLVKILSSQKIQIIKEFEYSMELADKLDDLASIVAINLDLIINQNQTSRLQFELVNVFEFNEFTFDHFNINKFVENIFETSSFSSFAVSLYAKCGKILANLFDLQKNPNSTKVSMDFIVRNTINTIYFHLNTNYFKIHIQDLRS